MKQLLTGVTIGVCATLAGYGLIGSASNTQNNDTEASSHYPSKYGRNWSGVSTNFHLGKVLPEHSAGLAPVITDDLPLMSLSILKPLEPITRNDIERVCLLPTHATGSEPSSYYVDITLTSSARNRIGTSLQDYDSQEASIHLWSYEINNFFVDAAKAKLFAEGKPDEEWWADIGFIVDEQATLEGFTLLKILTGKDTLEGCPSHHDAENMAGYQDHLKWWADYKQQYAAEH